MKDLLKKYENSGELQTNIPKSEIDINSTNNINEYSSISKKYELIENKDQLIKFLENCYSKSVIGFDCETNSLNAKTLVIFLEENCDVELLQVNLGKENSSLSQSTFFCLKENSSVNHGVVSYGENRSNLLNSLNVIQQKNSSYNLGSLHFKFNYARFEISIKQSAGNAKTNIKGMQITKKDEQISTYTKIEFNGPNGFLDQINKSLADDKSHAIFEGSIIVPKIAQRTDASQLSRNLLLSNLAQIDTKPQLEIIADDVKCKHGATISQLNEEELFYMRTRGITLTEASKLQLSSYFQEIISFIPISKDKWDLLDKLLNEN